MLVRWTAAIGLVLGVERNLAARAIRYRGTYDRAEQYLRGDVCTHDGCLFVAARDNPVDAPGVCPDWQIAPVPRRTVSARPDRTRG